MSVVCPTQCQGASLMIMDRRKGGLAATSPSELAAKVYRDIVTEFTIGISNFCRGTFGLTH